MKYNYRSKRGALNEVAEAAQELDPLQAQTYVGAHQTNVFDLPVAPPPTHAQTLGARAEPEPSKRSAPPRRSEGRHGVFTFTVAEGERVVMLEPDGRMEVLVGPRRVFKGARAFEGMTHHVAHPGEFLIVRYRDGRQEHLRGPVDLWLDPREHASIRREDVLQIAAREAVVVYNQGDDGQQHGLVERRIVEGPATFMPAPGEWLHTFAWHGSLGGAKGYRKVPNGLVFQKLWLLPDQMYHDVEGVRTADDAVITVRLMIFFELVDIERMLETTHDPIGDFVNAATSDVVDFVGRLDFATFKQRTDALNELETYRQLMGRASQCGYRIDKVVYRGYGAPAALQQMHDQAIESRTRLQLEQETQRQAQDLEDFKQERQIVRAARERQDRASQLEHDVTQARRRLDADLERERERLLFTLDEQRQHAELHEALARQRDARVRDHLGSLSELGVELTAYLTQGRADQVIELRGGHDDDERASPHLHLHPPRP